MTTASRPTFDPIRGDNNRDNVITMYSSSKDQPAHTKLKHRAISKQPINEDIRKETMQKLIALLPCEDSGLSVDEQDAVKDEEKEKDVGDETEELLAELEKIKKAKKNQEILTSNPLISRDFTVEARWDHDVVFRNQAKPTTKKRQYVNDTVNSEFHKKFMDKYIR
jgi:protein CWC15